VDYDIYPLEIVKFSNEALRFENWIIENGEIYHYGLIAEGKSFLTYF
jgi:hypothetical protein